MGLSGDISGKKGTTARTGEGDIPVSGQPVPRILLVDDDPIFGKIMTRLAEQSRVQMTFCRTLDELSEKAWWNYDAAIVDFDLGTATGLELIQQMGKFLGNLPTILISQSLQVDVPINQWPSSIRGFMHKALGHFAILEAALAAHDVAESHQYRNG